MKKSSNERYVLEGTDHAISVSGNSKIVAFGKDEELIRVQGDSSKAAHISVTLVADPDRSPTLAECIALPPWGSDGCKTFNDIEVDFKIGTVVTVCGSFIQVKARNLTSGLSASDNPRLGAFAGYLPYFKPGNATRSFNGGAVNSGGGSGLSVSVPLFATGVYVLVNPPVTNLALQFFDRTGTVIGAAPISSVISSPLIVLPNDARSIQLFNSGGSNVTVSRIIFELSL
jgi:hypothetical protein